MNSSLVDGHSVELLFLLGGAIRAGLIDALACDGAATADEIARRARADPRASGIVLEALVAEGVVERVERVFDSSATPLDTRYRLSRTGRAHLVEEGPELERSSLLHRVNKARGWLELPEVIRSGRPARWNSALEDTRTFVTAMGERDAKVLDEIRKLCLDYAGEVGSMLDVGGAVGHLARHFSRSGVRATLFDRENVIPLAMEFLGEETAAITFVGGDFTQSLPAGPFDLVYLGNVYHIYDPETNERITREVFSALPSGGTIAIQDYVWGRSPRAALFAVNMLQATDHGGVWTESQYREWLGAAGFRDVKVIDLQTAAGQLILGRKGL